MHTDHQIVISGRIYVRNPEVDRYQIPIEELDTLRMRDIPPRSHLEILRLPEPTGAFDMEVFALHSGTFPEDDSSLEIYGGASFKVEADGPSRIIPRLRRAFPDLDPDHSSFLPNPLISTLEGKEGRYVNLYMSLKFNERPDTLVRDAVVPFVEGFGRLEGPSAYVFICHASEDKPAARALALEMKKLGAEVWFDEWEIKVGESIVQKINDALGTVSHLVVLLSHTSVDKPWVRREMSSALMQQLSQKHITVLPLRLDDCRIPPILADIKYADCRNGMESALHQLERALFIDSAENNGA